MPNFRFLKALLALALASLSLGYAAPAAAQATRTWISGVGDDVNPCSRTAPCKTFQGAISKTAAGGEINCLDPGGFGAVTITKSISLICDNTEAGIVVAGSSAIVINSTTAYVVISGLDLEGLGNAPTTAGIHGVNVLNAASVTVRNTKIRGFRNGYGINFTPQSGNAMLFVDDVSITEGGLAANPATGGMLIQPAGNGHVRATVRDTLINDNLNVGVLADTTGNTAGSMRVMIEDSQIEGNDNGVTAVAQAASPMPLKLTVSSSSVSNNGGTGLKVDGAKGQIVATDALVSGNTTGLQSANGGLLISFKNNHVINNNVSNGTFSITVPET